MTARRWATAVCAHQLAGSRQRLPATTLGEEQWAGLLALVEDQRISGFLVSAIEDGAMPATDAQAEQAGLAHMRSMHTALLLERLTVELADALGTGGVECRVLKGAAYAHLDYPDPCLRSFGDVDVLVRQRDYERAVEVLVGLGAKRRVPELRPGYDRRFGKGGTFVMADGTEVDLHRTFVFGAFGAAIASDDLFATSAPFRAGGRELVALGPEERFLHACFHAALGAGTPRLLAQRDVVQILLGSGVDATRARHLAQRWGASAVVARAVARAWATFDLADAVPLSVWAAGYDYDRRERSVLDLYTTGASYTAQAAATLPAIRGLRPKAAFIRDLVLHRGPRRLRPGGIWQGARALAARVAPR
ncbi:MAG: nucleotidyltransferase family protein [Acidimicrobiales bacterium]